MRRRRRGPRTAPRCNTCGALIVFFRSPFTGEPRTFEPTPVPALTVAPRGDGQLIRSYPIESRRAWKYRELVDELMVRRECSREDAEQEAQDMPWHLMHHCPETKRTETTR